MPLGTNHMTTATGSVFIPEIWSNEIFPTFEQNLVLANLVTEVEAGNRGMGDVIHLPTPVRGVASAKVASNQVTLVAGTETEVQLTIDQHFEYSFLVEDLLALQALPSHRRLKMSDAGHQLATRVDTALFNLASALNAGAAYTGAFIGDGTTGYLTAGAGNGSRITDAGFRALIRRLDDQNIPQANRWYVTSPIDMENLRGISTWTENAFVGDGDVIKTGKFGKRYGVDIFSTTNSPTIEAADGSTQYRVGMLGHPGALALAMPQGIRIQSQKKLEFLGDLFVADVVFGTVELRDYSAVAQIHPAV